LKIYRRGEWRSRGDEDIGGYDRTGQDRKRQDRRRLERRGQDRTGQETAGQDRGRVGRGLGEESRGQRDEVSISLARRSEKWNQQSKGLKNI
jgi:hypothetical protein